jgi:hypothetical protein
MKIKPSIWFGIILINKKRQIITRIKIAGCINRYPVGLGMAASLYRLWNMQYWYRCDMNFTTGGMVRATEIQFHRHEQKVL